MKLDLLQEIAKLCTYGPNISSLRLQKWLNGERFRGMGNTTRLHRKKGACLRIGEVDDIRDRTTEGYSMALSYSTYIYLGFEVSGFGRSNVRTQGSRSHRAIN